MCFISPSHENTGTTVYDKKTNQFEFLPVQGQTVKEARWPLKKSVCNKIFFFISS